MQLRKLSFPLAVVLFAASAIADSSVYVVTAAQQFGVVDLTTGAFSQIGANTPEVSANLVPGPNGTFYSLATESGSLQSINPATGATKTIGPTGLGSSAFSLGEVNGNLYLTDFSNNFYTVNPATGAASQVGPTGIPPDPAIPFTMNPDGTLNLCDESLYNAGDKLYATFDAFTINPATLAVTQIVAPELWRIDPATGLATLVGPTALNLDTLVNLNGTFYGVRIVPTSFSAQGPEELNELVTLNLSNGNTAFVRNIDAAAGPIFGAAPVPEPASIIFTALGIAAIAIGKLRRRNSTSVRS